MIRADPIHIQSGHLRGFKPFFIDKREIYLLLLDYK